MFLEENYVQPAGEPAGTANASENGCIWAAACLYERKSGGFDVFYDHENSDFKPLKVETITKFRHLSEGDGGIFFIAHLSGHKMDRHLFNEAKTKLLEWVRATARIDS